MKREANVTLESSNKWILQSYSPYISDDELVCYGDVIWLHYIETEKTLVTDKNYEGV